MAKPLSIAPAAFILTLCCPLCRTSEATESRPTASTASPDGAEQAEIARLVRELGSPVFATRQHAQRALVGFGPRAKSALQTACDDPDREIQRRARAALAAVDDVDFYARLGAFLADRDVQSGHGLPGWQRYRELVGADQATRRLFAEMQRAERELLAAVDRAPVHAAALLDARCQQIDGTTQSSDAERHAPLSLGTIAALVFAASHGDVPVSDQAGKCIGGVGNQRLLGEAVHAQPTAHTVRALLGAWVSRRFNRDSLTSYQNLWLAMQFNLKQALPAALHLIEPPGGHPLYEQYAILAVGKLGGPEHAAALLPLLDDDRPLAPRERGNESNTQIRDVALAVMIHLTGQKLSDYGFTHAKSNPLLLFASNTLGFDDPAAREKAIAKWRTWWQARAAQTAPAE